jgi:hypothetical protein
VFNLAIFLLGLTVLYGYASTTALAVPPARPDKPQPSAGAGEATHLSYISYTKNGGETRTLTHPLGSDRHTLQPATAAHPLVSQPEPTEYYLWVIRKLNKLLCSCLPIA